MREDLAHADLADGFVMSQREEATHDLTGGGEELDVCAVGVPDFTQPAAGLVNGSHELPELAVDAGLGQQARELSVRRLTVPWRGVSRRRLELEQAAHVRYVEGGEPPRGGSYCADLPEIGQMHSCGGFVQNR